MSYKIEFNRISETHESLRSVKMREGELRALRLNYTITYPDGFKIKCEVIK